MSFPSIKYRRFFLAVFEKTLRWRWSLLYGVLVLSACGAIGASQVRLDMSFRPLFVANDSVAVSTRSFESLLGQRSGAFIGVIIEADSRLDTPFFHFLNNASRAVGSIPGVVETQSISDFALVDWMNGTPVGKRIRGVQATPTLSYTSSTPATTDPITLARRRFISEDGKSTILLARLAPPLNDLNSRRVIIDAFKQHVGNIFPPSYSVHYVGVSVVEEAYSRIVLTNLIRSVLLTGLVLSFILWYLFRSTIGVLVALSGSVAATIISLSVLNVLGYPLTIITSVIPVVILVIGIADAIHMLNTYFHWRGSQKNEYSIRRMLVETGTPCLLTTITTAVGFASLALADMTAIRQFGLATSISTVVVYLLNLILIPSLLSILGTRFDTLQRRGPRSLGRIIDSAFRISTRRPVLVTTVFATLLVGCLLAIPAIHVDQPFNKEVHSTHPVRLAQDKLEKSFGGILGPEISIIRQDGDVITRSGDLTKIRRFEQSVGEIEGTLSVQSLSQFLPARVAYDQTAIKSLQTDPVIGSNIAGFVSRDLRTASVVVRTRDMGSRQAGKFVDQILHRANTILGDEYRVEIVGQWWLAQRGMNQILGDLVSSFLAASVFLLPILAFALGSRRLFLVSILPNFFPIAAAFGFAVLIGMPLRIGTAMVLAVALGIAVDDTIHFMSDLKRGRGSAEDRIRFALKRSGSAMLITTGVLVAGFLSMAIHELITLRDMGILASVVIIAALVADLLLAPALFVLTDRIKKERAERTGIRGTSPTRWIDGR